MKKLGFGMMRLPLLEAGAPKKIDIDQVCKMTDHFLAEGYTYFDTAYMYHEHESERALKTALADRHARESYLVADKLPTMFLKSEEDQERVFAEQLTKCGVEYFDYYLLHCLTVANYEIATRLNSFAFLQQKKKEGEIRKLGFSFHDSAALLDEILTAHPETEFVQLQVNCLDWESESVQSRACCEVAQKHGKQIIVMEPVKGGTLANLPAEAEKLLRDSQPDWSAAEWAIRFTLGIEGVIMVLSGMSTIGQMEENTRFMSDLSPLSPEQTSVLWKAMEVMRASVAIPCTNCRYCVDECPQAIAIPEYFTLYNAVKQSFRSDGSAQMGSFEALAKAGEKPSACISCGACVRHCPQQIAIPDQLAAVAKMFEG